MRRAARRSSRTTACPSRIRRRRFKHPAAAQRFLAPTMAQRPGAPDAGFGAQLPQSVREEFEKAAEFSINSTKCVVEDLEFVGNIRTRSSFLRRQFASTMKAQNLRDILLSSRDGVQGLRDLGMFDSIEAKILLDETSKVQGAAAARVQVHLQEKRIFKLKALGTLGGSTGSGGIEATIGNALGVADTLAGHVEYVTTPSRIQIL
jgi:outer membrane protein assembly factor BamA